MGKFRWGNPHFWRVIAVLSVVASPVGTDRVYAQSSPDQEQRRIQERLDAQQKQLQAPRRVQAPPEASVIVAKPDLIPVDETPCFTIKWIELNVQSNGISAVDRLRDFERFSWLFESVAGVDHNDSPIGKCLGAKGVALVLKRTQDAVVAKGYVTTRVLTQRQDLSTGILAITVIPGYVSAIRFKGDTEPGVRSSNTVPVRPGEILSLRDVEQGLENFKRVSSAEADIKIEPAQDGAAINQSDLVIVYQQQTPARFSVTADDSGSKGTGKYQGSATLSLDNPLGVSDLFYFTGNHDMGGGDVGARGTRGHTVHYSLPAGYWTLGATYSSSRYFQNVAGLNQDYVYSGTSENSEIKLTRLVYRDAIRKTSLSLKGWQRKSNNYIDDTEVQVQRRVVGGWELGINHKDAVGKTTLESSLAWKRGTKDFDSIPAPEEAFNEGTSKLGVLTLDLNAALPFKTWGSSFKYNAALHVQDNTTPLTPQDRFSIGSRYSVRGFDGESSLVGERGWSMRNEVSTALGASGQEVYLGIDAGEVSGPSSENLAGKSLVGGVIGVRGSFNSFKTTVQYDLFAGAPISKPSGFKTAETAAGFSLNVVF